jgi:hypothetical protein
MRHPSIAPVLRGGSQIYTRRRANCVMSLRAAVPSVYDNLGLETVCKRCATVLISDGGGQTPDDSDPPGDWPRQSIRVLKVVDNQGRALRKGQAFASYRLGLRRGT